MIHLKMLRTLNEQALALADPKPADAITGQIAGHDDQLPHI